MRSLRQLADRIFPLQLLPGKVKRAFLRDLLRRDSALASILDFKMHVPLQISGIGQTLFLNGHRELDQHEILRQVLRPNATVMDIGANIGYYVIIEGRSIGGSGQIYAFEPDPRSLDFLHRNIRLNGLDGIVEVSPKAVSDINGTVTFNLAAAANLSSVYRMRGSNHPSVVARGLQHRKYVKELSVKSVAFCEFLESAARAVDLVRMDLEGYEVEILGSLAAKLNASPHFSRAPTTFVFEPHSWEYDEDHSLRSVLETLATHGYRITFLGSRDENTSPIRKFGYSPYKILPERSGLTRGVYKDIAQNHALELASDVDGVTTVCLQRDTSSSPAPH